MKQGKILRDPAKGFAFIGGDDGQDVFLHRSAYLDEWDDLRAGDTVQYDQRESVKRPGKQEAYGVRLVSD